MKMEIETEYYWPQHKVFFLATVALFPENLKDFIVTLLFYRPYFANDDIDLIELTLKEYEKDEYIKYEKLSTGEFKINEVDTNKATDDLIDYLEKWQNNKLVLLAAKKTEDAQHQQKLLLEALTRAYKRSPSNQLRITPEDVYELPNNDIFGTPFWELMLSLQLSEQPSAVLTHIAYDRHMDGLYINGTQPFADIKITSPELLRSIELASKSSEPISDEEPQETPYNGLRANRDESVSYNGETIPFTPQEASVMRVFIARPEEWRSDDSFTDPQADVFENETLPNLHKSLSQLISRTRIKLNVAVGNNQNCIINKRSRGWKLEIQPTD